MYNMGICMHSRTRPDQTNAKITKNYGPCVNVIAWNTL